MGVDRTIRGFRTGPPFRCMQACEVRSLPSPSEIAETKMRRSFRFTVSVYDRHWIQDGKPDRMDPATEFPSKFCALISRMTAMNQFEFTIPEEACFQFEKSFFAHSISLPSVTNLILSPFTEWVVHCCPAVVEISTSRKNWLHSKRGHESEV
ncbi:hypothetical protein BD410DRAFT_585255 [Rickenella mellea]|uniref:Uncharacterized protein n=1 Tax=Rickenella mellea TaxID=50990 RepID=A0A4Y7PPU5_9AGAM|nr:hypothetical protein BD410DRAFT_585255 [Rickenella mellea]